MQIMLLLQIAVLLVVLTGMVAGVVWWRRHLAGRRERELDDARAEARRWYERLGGQVYHLGGEATPVRQALADAGERYNAAGAQLGEARTAYQFRLAAETALEGLMYARAARVALGMDPGPELPTPAEARGAGRITERREAQVQGRTYRADPAPSDDTPYYYPGGRVQDQPVPAGWYSEPWWRPTATGVGAGMGTMLVMGALLPPVPDLGPGAGHGPADGGGFEPSGDIGGIGGIGDVGGDAGGT